MFEIDSAAWLSVGPRGRRLLWATISDDLGPAWPAAFVGPQSPGAAELIAELEPAVERAVGAVALTAVNLSEPFATTVDAAYYWQEPDGVDRALVHPEVRAALVPLVRWVGGPLVQSAE